MKSLKPRSTFTPKQAQQLIADALGAAAFTCVFFGLLMIETYIHQPLLQGV